MINKNELIGMETYVFFLTENEINSIRINGGINRQIRDESILFKGVELNWRTDPKHT